MVSILTTVVSLLVTAAATVILEEVISFVIRRGARLAGASKTVIRDVGVGLRVVAALVILSEALSLFGLASEFTALTISGIGALTISLALQTTLSNIISGFLLFTDGVVRLDDEIEYSGIKGKVVRLALRNTWIKKEDGTLAVVSNSSLSGGPLVNHTAAKRLLKRYAIE